MSPLPFPARKFTRFVDLLALGVVTKNPINQFVRSVHGAQGAGNQMQGGITVLSIRKCSNAGLFGFLGFSTTNTWGQVSSSPLVNDPSTPIDTSVTGETPVVSEDVMTTIEQAFTGDTDKIVELLTMALPAMSAILFIIVGYLVASYIGRVVGELMSKRLDVTLGRFVGKAVKMSVLVLVLIGALEKFGFNITSFAAIIAALGFAMGMALQGTLSNFAAGIMLLVFRPYKVDEYIVVDGTEGLVEEIDLFTTRLNTLDNRHIIVPNGQIFGSKIENYSRNRYRRVDVNVGADYSADLDRTRAALEMAVRSITTDENAPASQVYLMELGDSAVAWQVRVWCDPTHYWGVREQLTAATKRHLDAAKIGIPFPQLDVNVVGKLLARAA